MLISTRGRYALRVMIDLAEHQSGGYKLTRAPEAYRVGDILRLTEGDLAPVACLECGAKPCERMEECRTISMWMGFNRVINEYFDGVTIADLMREQPLLRP